MATLSLEDVRTWTEALASCAIENNKFAQELLELKRTDYKKFLVELVRLNNGIDRELLELEQEGV